MPSCGLRRTTPPMSRASSLPVDGGTLRDNRPRSAASCGIAARIKARAKMGAALSVSYQLNL